MGQMRRDFSDPKAEHDGRRLRPVAFGHWSGCLSPHEHTAHSPRVNARVGLWGTLPGVGFVTHSALEAQ